MGNDSKIKDAAEVVKGIVEHVPVYQDLLQPAAKELGMALQTIAKTVHIALAPVSALVWGYDQIKEWLQVTLTEKLKNVPPEEIVPPRVAVAGPAIEALRFAADEPVLRELYANLLATSMSSKRQGKAHPAFVDIIKQLEVADVHILNLIYQSYREWRDQFSMEHSGEEKFHYSPVGHSTGKYELIDKLEMLLASYESSIDNLIRVRCVAPFVENKQIDTEVWDFRHIEDVTVDHGYERVRMTTLGVNFVEACMGQETLALCNQADSDDV